VPALRADGAGVRLGDRTVLAGVTFAVAPGALVAVVGPNGAGKTTLLRALAGLIPHTGRIDLDGRPVRDWPPRERARRLAFVRQAPPGGDAFTVRETVALGRAPHLAWTAALTRADHAAVDDALDALGLADLADRPLGELSGGERQRAALAQALAQDTPTLLLDEPTAHLDVRHTLDLLARARALADAGRTVVAAVHDLGLAARVADRMLVVAGGTLAADGAPADVLTRELLADVFGVEATVTAGPDGPAVRYLRPLPPSSLP
jgi:iron complex transport system ATP-binding protein